MIVAVDALYACAECECVFVFSFARRRGRRQEVEDGVGGRLT